MNLYLRLLRVLLRGYLGNTIHYSSTVESQFRVLPHDLDAFGHMNNGRYLQIMDVARMDWMLQTGVFGVIRRHRWTPLLGGGFMRFRYSLGLLQPYSVCTRLLCWDRRWFFLEHSFLSKSRRCVAVGITRAALRSDGQWVDTKNVANLVHQGAESPVMPEYVRDWLQLEEEMYSSGQLNTKKQIVSIRSVS